MAFLDNYYLGNADLETIQYSLRKITHTNHLVAGDYLCRMTPSIDGGKVNIFLFCVVKVTDSSVHIKHRGKNVIYKKNPCMENIFNFKVDTTLAASFATFNFYITPDDMKTLNLSKDNILLHA